MGNLSDYFAKVAYQATFSIGDRVEGHWRGMPFVGSVGNDRLISEERGPEVTVHVDLPIKQDGKFWYVILVSPKELKLRY